MVRARQAIVDVPGALIAAGSLLLLWRLKLRFKEPALVGTAALTGLLSHSGG